MRRILVDWARARQAVADWTVPTIAFDENLVETYLAF
jgi:hypothetical protein